MASDRFPFSNEPLHIPGGQCSHPVMCHDSQTSDSVEAIYISTLTPPQSLYLNFIKKSGCIIEVHVQRRYK